MVALGICCCMGFSLVVESGGYSPVVVHGVPIAVVPPVADHGPWRARVELWLADSVAPRPVGSSQTSGGARVPCSGGQILIHCTTREVPPPLFTTKLEQQGTFSVKASCANYNSHSTNNLHDSSGARKNEIVLNN